MQAVTTRMGAAPELPAHAPVTAAIIATAPKIFIAFLPPPVQAEKGREKRPKPW
jgi:hypothetical protein